MLSVLDRLLMIAICAVLLWGNFFGGEFRIEWFVYAQTAAYLITAAMAFFIVLRRAGFGHFHWNLPFFLVILRKSLPFALLSLLMAFYNRADSVFIERLLDGSEGERQSGIYSQAFRLLDAFNQIAWLFAVLLLPIYSRMIRFRQPLDRMVRLPFSILFTTGLIVSITSFFFRHEIMMWLYPQNPAETAEAFSLRMSQSVEVYGILMFGFLGSTTMYVFSTLLTANGSLKSLNLVAFGGLLVNFSLNLVLIPVMLAKGAAIASLVTQLATAGAYVAVCQSRFRFKPDYRYIGSLILFAGIVTGASLAVKAAGLMWVQAFLIALAGSVAAAFSLRLVSPAEILRMLRGSDKGDGEYDHTGT
jgi:O-antigen/teichoic acid export membrane protein